MKSTQPKIPVLVKEKSIATILQHIDPIPKPQLSELKGGGNPWIDAS